MQPIPFDAVYIKAIEKREKIINKKGDLTEVDKDIIEACKSGSRKAQFDLYSKYAAAMYNVCCRMLKNSHDAEDILQNTFVDIFSKLDSFGVYSRSIDPPVGAKLTPL